MPKNKDIETLLEISKNPSTNQRSLARTLNISLGLTNEILQNLIHRGWVKANKLTGKKWLYLITPTGIAKTAQFAYSRFQETQKYFWDAENMIINLLNALYQKGKKKLFILGANQYTKLIFLASTDTPIKLQMIISDDQSKKIFLGYSLVTINNFIKFIKESQQTSQEFKDTIIISTNQQEKERFIEEVSETGCQEILKTLDIIDIDDLMRKYMHKDDFS